jgi:hypothetical protein
VADGANRSLFFLHYMPPFSSVLFLLTKNEQEGTVALAGVWWTFDSFSFLFLLVRISRRQLPSTLPSKKSSFGT